MKLTLGFSPCPNDTFIFAAMANGLIDCQDFEFEFVIKDVEELNQQALLETLDVTKLSFHAYAHCYDSYILLRSGSALGRGCGPLLICRPGFDHSSLTEARIAIPGKLTTANFLLDFYQNGCNKEVYPFDQIETAIAEGGIDAGVIIHENRFTYASHGLDKIVDLGAHWEDQTELPIPLGGIVGLRKLPMIVLQRMSGLIRESLDFAYANPAAVMPYVRAHAQEMDDSVMSRHIGLYVNEYSKELDTVATSAITHFLAKCGVESELPVMVEKYL